MRPQNNTRSVLIDGILRQSRTGKGVLVKVKATGKTAWVPNHPESFFPGRVELPEPLARRILQNKPQPANP